MLWSYMSGTMHYCTMYYLLLYYLLLYYSLLYYVLFTIILFTIVLLYHLLFTIRYYTINYCSTALEDTGLVVNLILYTERYKVVFLGRYHALYVTISLAPV